MDLGELEFKAEEVFPEEDHTLEYWKKEIADEANRILREKLERALEVFGYEHKHGSSWHTQRADDLQFRGRLVCIEEIK